MNTKWKRETGTHVLETVQGGTCSEHGKKSIEQGLLTSYGPQREGLFRTLKKIMWGWALTF